MNGEFDDELLDEMDEEYPCSCPYCHCGNTTPNGEICSDCLAGVHQG